MLNTILFFLFICFHYLFVQAEVLFGNKKIVKIITVLLCFIIYLMNYSDVKQIKWLNITTKEKGDV